MPIATGLALGLAGIGAAGAFGGAALSANAAGHAASTQAGAAEQAAQLQAEAQRESLGFQEGVYNQGLNLASPYYSAGISGLTNLENLMGILPASASRTPIPTPQPINIPGIPSAGIGMQGPSGTAQPAPPTFGAQPGGRSTGMLDRIPGPGPGGTFQLPPHGTATPGAPGARPVVPGAQPRPVPNNLASLINPNLGASGSLMTPFTTPFQAPTNVTEQNDPGYKFRLDQGTQALQNSAAARGDLLSGNTLRDVTQYGQDYASNEYGNVYNRALGQYQLAQNNSTNIFNRLADIAGLGQTATQQIAGQGQGAANNISNLLPYTASQIGRDIQNAGAATASGYVGQANAYGGAIGGGMNNLMDLLLLTQMGRNGGGSSSVDYPGVYN